MSSTHGLLSLLMLLIPLCAKTFYDCPMPRCSSCLPTSVHDAPGLGFDLTTSYGTSAVHNYDGSIADLAKVPANTEYLAMMQRLSNSTSKPADSAYQRYLRRLNKALGRPATHDVGVLSSLLSELKISTEARLSTPIDRVVVTTPQFEGLTSEDLKDALEYAGLRSWLIYLSPYPTQISEANAAFAANGNGLCKQYTNLYECQDEDMPLHQVYAVTFTRKALHAALVPIAEAFSTTTDQHIIDFDAGLDSLSSYSSPSVYWAHVRAQLTSLPESATGWGRRPITKILLLGESAGDPDFQTALKDALSEITMGPAEVHPLIWFAEPDVRLDIVADPLYAAARGAALYARWRQEVPWDCTEEERCEDERKRERTSPRSDEL